MQITYGLIGIRCYSKSIFVAIYHKITSRQYSTILIQQHVFWCKTFNGINHCTSSDSCQSIGHRIEIDQSSRGPTLLTEIQKLCGHLFPVELISVFDIIEYQSLAFKICAVTQYKIHDHGGVGKHITIWYLYHGVGIVDWYTNFGSAA